MAWKLISMQRLRRPSRPGASAGTDFKLHRFGPDDLRAIHQAKLAYPGVRLSQHG